MHFFGNLILSSQVFFSSETGSLASQNCYSIFIQIFCSITFQLLIRLVTCFSGSRAAVRNFCDIPGVECQRGANTPRLIRNFIFLLSAASSIRHLNLIHPIAVLLARAPGAFKLYHHQVVLLFSFFFPCFNFLFKRLGAVSVTVVDILVCVKACLLLTAKTSLAGTYRL